MVELRDGGGDVVEMPGVCPEGRLGGGRYTYIVCAFVTYVCGLVTGWRMQCCSIDVSGSLVSVL